MSHDEAADEQSPEVSTATPSIRVVKGNPTDQDLAALVAVLTAAQQSANSSAPEQDPELWGLPSELHRTFEPHSPYAYTASGRHRS